MKIRASLSRTLLPSCSFVSFVVVASLLAGCTIGKEPKHPNWKNATGAEQYERLMWQAIRDKNWQDLEYHLAPTFVGVNARGQVLDREGWREYWKDARVKEFSIGEVSVHPSGANMVVTFVLRLASDKSASTGESGPSRVISNWQQVKGGWILTSTSITPVVSP